MFRQWRMPAWLKKVCRGDPSFKGGVSRTPGEPEGPERSARLHVGREGLKTRPAVAEELPVGGAEIAQAGLPVRGIHYSILGTASVAGGENVARAAEPGK